ncbi:MAG: PAS domain-containing protein [Janthinobacterium lividum]
MSETLAPGMDFQRLFEASPNPYLVLDRRLHIAGANRAYLASVKRELSEIIGRWAWDAFPADADMVRQAVASFELVIRTRQPDTMPLLRFDVPRPEAEGGGFMVRYWSITHIPVLDVAGNISLVLQHPIDVTELQHLRCALEHVDDPGAASLVPAHSGIFSRARSVQESNLALKMESSRLNALFVQAPSFMALLQGREHRIELANASYMRLVGRREVIGRTIAEALPDAVEQGYLDLLDRVFDSGEAHAATGALYIVQADPDGPAVERFVDFVYQPIKDSEGRVTGIFLEGSDVTDRMLGDAALRTSEARNRQILDSAIDHGIIATDLEGRVTRWNEGARRILGWCEEEMLGQPAARFFTPEDVAAGQVNKEMRAALSTGRGIDERWHQRKGGERFWASGEMTVLRDEAGTAVGFVKVLRDRTRQRHLDEELRASRERLSALVSASSEVRYSLSSDWNEMRQLSGGGFLADTGSANPSWFAEYIPADEQPRVRAAIDEAIRTKGLFHLEHRVHQADGGVGWTLSRAVPLLDAAGQITEWFGAASDITARREAEDALRRLNETLEEQVTARTAERNRLWNSSPDLLLIIDFHGMFRRVNPAWTSLLGYEPDELVGHHVNEFVVPDDASKTTDAYELAASGGLPKIENRYWHKDGSTRWISWVAVPVGDLTYATGRDVTAQKAAAQQLADTQEALRQSQKMEAVGQLTGGLAHDFNNLLAGITGNLELLQTRIAQGRIGDVDRYVNAAQGAARRAAALTHRLLAFSRRQTLDPKPTDVGRLVGGMEELIRRTVGPQIMVTPVEGDELWATLVDQGQLENALLNLCINARDAMPDGGRITIESGNRLLDERSGRQRDMLPGQYVSLCVSDTGTGMTPEVVAKAFDPFFTTKPIGQGTGLGLSMTYGFAKQSGGQVRIHSLIGQGTTVCLYLPRHLGEAESAGPEPELADVPRAEQGETVLVIDDEATVRMLVTEVLEDLGYRPLEAADGAAGLQVLQSNVRIDLLVTDVGLPGGMNGRQVADAARVARPNLKVLFITGYAENAVLSHGHLEPGMHILTKPFAMDMLARRIKELIDREKATGGPERVAQH